MDHARLHALRTTHHVLRFTHMPTVAYERQLLAQGYGSVAGIDEAGRGCWAGPVVAAAVVLRPEVIATPELLDGVDDSKRLAAGRREELVSVIRRHAAGIGVGYVPAFLIDQLGIIRATRLAMELAVLQLPALPQALIVDALRLPAMPLPQLDLIGADRLSYSVAAASIIAKTSRDRIMALIERDRPCYGFALHKGYGTTAHRAALQKWGPCGEHRRSFRPLWNEGFDGN